MLCAKEVVGNAPFAVILADDLIDAGAQGCLSQMVGAFAREQCSLLGVEKVDPEETDKHGVVRLSDDAQHPCDVVQIVEKPPVEQAPSNLAVVGRYILTPRIFGLLENTRKGAGGEIQLTDAIADLLAEKRVVAFPFEGQRYDCGSKIGYLKATVEYALKHPRLRGEFL